jgi:hypothetical protein
LEFNNDNFDGVKMNSDSFDLNDINENSNLIESQNNNNLYCRYHQTNSSMNFNHDAEPAMTRAKNDKSAENLTANEPPEIIPIPNQIVHESHHNLVDLKYYVSDPDDNLSDLKFSVDSDYVVVTGHSLAFLGVKELPDQVILTVSDGYYNVSDVIEIELKLEEQPKQPSIWDILMNYICFGLIFIVLLIALTAIYFYKKNQYFIDELFLIHKSGTLINNLISHRKQTNVDDIIFSGMFTAVQDYIADTFEKARNGEGGSCGRQTDCVLDELKLGDKKILIERSENAYLAVIFKGEGISLLRKKVKKKLNEIETKYEDVLPTWDGEIKALAGTKEILNILMKNKNYKSKNNKSKGEISTSTRSVKQTKTKPINKKMILKENKIKKTKSRPLIAAPRNPSWKVKVKMSDDGSEVEFDTSKSLFKQLMAMDENSKK